MVNHFKSTVRRLLRHRSFVLINVAGLSIGIAVCLLIYLYVRNELTYDGYNVKKDRIARLTSSFHTPESDLTLAASPPPLAPAMVRDYPEIEAAVRIQPADDIIVRMGSALFKEGDACYSEQAIFSVFTFNFLEGQPAGALDAPGSMVISQDFEKRYFGKAQALGQTLICEGKPWRITAVFADRPANSNIPIRALLYRDYRKVTDWVNNDFDLMTFVLFRGKPDWKRFTSRLPQLERYTRPAMDAAGAKGYRLSFQAEKLTDLHFSTGDLGDEDDKGNRQFNTIFSVLAVFILLIALLNYINLSTTKAIERAKEVGVRKVIGARPIQLLRQFLGESLLLIAIALLVAVGLTAAAIPLVNHSLGIHLSFSGWSIVVFLLLLFPLLALGGGLYPAFVLSSYQPIKVLKGGVGGKGRGFLLRKILTVVQFVIALAMLTGTAVIYSQMQYIAHKDLGVDRSGIVRIELPVDDSLLQGRSKAFCEALNHESGVHALSVGSGLPIEGASLSSTTARSDNGKKREMMCRYFMIDPVFLPLMKISLVSGRNFSDSLSTDKTEAFLVNESFVSKMGWKNPLGQAMEGQDHKGRVVGVVRNFFFSSLHNMIEPLAMVYTTARASAVLVKISPADIPRIKEVWKRYFPDRVPDYGFLDQEFNEQYNKDRMMMILFNGFTVFALFISCLGLYGLVALITLQRTKELGIRKVLGASVFHLVALQSKEQVLLVGWAALIALPLAGIGGQRWLASYAWHTHLSVWMFVWPVVTILLLALAVTGLRVTRSALANPIESLRSATPL